MLRLAAVLVVLPGPVVDAKCAMMGLEPAVLTKPNAAVTSDGGIVVGAADADGDRLDKGDVAVQAGWKLRADNVGIAPKIETIAPGLAVYHFPQSARKVALEDAKGKALAAVTVGMDKSWQLDAPKVKRITHAAGFGRRPFAHITVEATGAVPDHALAIVLVDDKGKARSWHTVEPGKPTAAAYDLTRCRVLANGTVESKPGDKVTVFWVDEAGRRSAASKPLAITGTPTTTDD